MRPLTPKINGLPPKPFEILNSPQSQIVPSEENFPDMFIDEFVQTPNTQLALYSE